METRVCPNPVLKILNNLLSSCLFEMRAIPFHLQSQTFVPLQLYYYKVLQNVSTSIYTLDHQESISSFANDVESFCCFSINIHDIIEVGTYHIFCLCDNVSQEEGHQQTNTKQARKQTNNKSEPTRASLQTIHPHPRGMLYF